MPYKQNATNGPNYLKPGRTMPPRVDTSAASMLSTHYSSDHANIPDRPFFPQDQLTPVSASPSRTGSPMNGNDGRRSPFGNPSRAALRQRSPPSPDALSSNLDSAFPIFPTKQDLQKAQQGGGYGYGGMGRNFGGADPMYAPVSPRNVASGGLLQRMNTIAPGPFNVNGRGRAGESSAERGHRRQATSSSIKDTTMSSRDAGANIRRPSTAEPGHSRTSTNSSKGSRSGIIGAPGAPRVPRKDGYGGFGPPASDETPMRPFLSPDSRSQTFPLSNEGQGPSSRRPSEPGAGPRFRRPSNESYGRTPLDSQRSISGSPPRQRKPSISGPDLSRPLPPRGASVIRPKIDSRFGDAPPVPANLNLAAEFGIGNPYHTPSESQSSSASGYSQESKTSSRSSPPLSTGPSPNRSRRRPSDASRRDGVMADLEASMSEMRTTNQSSPPRNAQLARPMRRLDPAMLSPESPMDPAIQGGRLSPIPSRNPERTRTPSRPSAEEKPARRPTTSKGDCKGCGEPIKGKSVSSADGRLTGRYHKQCFVCQTCSEPFATSTFYVIDDAPYCERHYHKLNGSVCSTCDKGIEGQYLESERKQKFHPGCLTCADCKRTLRNDYFEMNGQVYCERDAFRRAQQGRFLGVGGPGAGSNRMERRTTRMMMM
jgi:hypothetical protein